MTALKVFTTVVFLHISIYVETFSFQIKLFSFPLLDNYRQSGSVEDKSTTYMYIYIYRQRNGFPFLVTSN